MKKHLVLIFGTGHLVYRLKKMLPEEGFTVKHSTIDNIQSLSDSDSILENIEIYLSKIDLSKVAMVYLLDDKDEYNLQLIIALISFHKTIPITASLFNENLIPHLEVEHKNVVILNPAKIAAPVFVDAVYSNVDNENNKTKVEIKNTIKLAKKDILIYKLLLGFLLLISTAIVYFHYYEKMTWIDALYFVVVTITTVGYGDINLLNSSALSKFVGIVLMLSSMVFIWMIFSLIIDRFLRIRIQLALGRKKYTVKNHIVVCGLGRLGYFIIEELIKRKEKIIIIEQDENAKYINYCRQLGAEVYIGDAKLQQVLIDVNVKEAKALLSVVSNDSVNLEIGLNARTIKNEIKLILRIFDEKMANNINEYLNIHLTYSASEIADNIFYNVLKENKAEQK
jgi:voltage-gated potassium channel Kch